MAAPSALDNYTTRPDFVTIQPRPNAVIVANTQNTGIGDVYQIGGNIYNVNVGDKVFFTKAYFFTIESSNFASVYKEDIAGTYVEVLPP